MPAIRWCWGVPNQPDPDKQHLTISAVPRTLWANVQAAARDGKDRTVVVAVVAGESVSAAVRRFLEEYTK
jgi:hypothetical protein